MRATLYERSLCSFQSFERTWASCTGIVDENVDGSFALDDCRHRPMYGFIAEHVKLQPLDVRPQCFHLFHVPRGGVDATAAMRKLFGPSVRSVDDCESRQAQHEQSSAQATGAAAGDAHDGHGQGPPL
jgi:hypothetical protein